MTTQKTKNWKFQHCLFNFNYLWQLYPSYSIMNEDNVCIFYAQFEKFIKSLCQLKFKQITLHLCYKSIILVLGLELSLILRVDILFLIVLERKTFAWLIAVPVMENHFYLKEGN